MVSSDSSSEIKPVTRPMPQLPMVPSIGSTSSTRLIGANTIDRPIHISIVPPARTNHVIRLLRACAPSNICAAGTEPSSTSSTSRPFDAT